MKVSLSWTTIPAVIFVLVIGCGDSDNPIGEDTQEPPTEPPTNIVSPILGDWRLMDLIWLKDGAVIQQTDGSGRVFGRRVYLALAPDGIFEVTERHPIDEEQRLHFLKWKGWDHIQEIVVTFRGRFHIAVNQLRLSVIVTRVKPKEEALEIRPGEFENVVLIYDVWYNDGEPLNYILTDDGSQLELIREKGERMVKFIHLRTKTEKNTS